MNAVRTVQSLGGSAALLSLLTACPQPQPPYNYTPPVSLNVRFPDTPARQDLKLAAIYFEQTTPTTVTLKVLAQGSLNSGTGTVNAGRLDLYGYQLDTLKQNALCVTPFKGGETKDMQNVVVTPDTVKTCNVYFTLFNDADGNDSPTSSEELYLTHDLYGYASAAFTYSFTSPDGFSTETGSRAAGWSLVRHEVIQPSATPGQYRVSMNSLPAADQAIAIRLHEDSNRLISMGLSSGRAGGLK